MAEKNVDQLKAHYTELSKLAPSQDWERILKVAKKILDIAPAEKKAVHTQIVCLINTDKFDKALEAIESFSGDASDFLFERAYCEYRLNKLEAAFQTLMKSKQMGNKENELLAQVNYKLEKFQESFETYKELVKNVDDEFDTERQTNLSAALALLRTTNPSSNKDFDMTENENRTYELCYNSACISISKENFPEAHSKLVKAENMCKKTFEEEDPEFDNEVAIIRIQLGYCLQKLGKAEDALKIYNSVIKNKPSDNGIVAVASNNLVCLNKDQNIFDSKKKLKTATSSELDLKLNSIQRSVIAYNEVIFSIITNQINNSNFERACQVLEKMRSFRPSDLKILSKLINLYSRFDNSKVKKLSDELPSLEEVQAKSNLDIETLETQFTLLNSKYGKSKSMGVKSSSSSGGAAKKDTKKKKPRGKLPKNYNPAIPMDPERWLPLRERSYYKGKRNKKNAIGKGTQGAVSGKEPPVSSPNPAQSPKPGLNSPEQGAKPKLPPSAQVKKKKKHGSKW